MLVVPKDDRTGGGPTARAESTRIRGLLGGSILRRSSSVELGWKSFAIERRTILAGDKPEAVLDHHFLLLWDVHVAEGETAHRDGRYVRYRKRPNTVTACPPGSRPAVRSASKHEVIVGALDADFFGGMEEELDRRPKGTLRTLYGTEDPDLRNLLLLLLKESETGGQCGVLYVDSLVAALAARLSYAERSQPSPPEDGVSPLPLRPLRRVLERMQADLAATLDLRTLAVESGYSRGHFLRMFRAATGQTPHRYLMELRLAKARDLIAGSTLPLIEIAAACGFSGHGHLTTSFRARFGSTPSAYRRGL